MLGLSQKGDMRDLTGVDREGGFDPFTYPLDGPLERKPAKLGTSASGIDSPSGAEVTCLGARQR
jgi:hypothetical protein